MSEARLELFEPCEHGYVELPNDQSRHAQSSVPGGCPGGSRRVLSVPTDQMVDAATAEMAKRTGRDIFVSDLRAALTAAFNTLGIQETE
jgi:hypothetical protein